MFYMFLLWFIYIYFLLWFIYIHIYIYIYIYIYPSLILNVFILGNTKTNGLIPLSNNPSKYLELALVLTNFEITDNYIINIIIRNIYWAFNTIKILFCYFCLAKSQHCYSIKKKNLPLILAN